MLFNPFEPLVAHSVLALAYRLMALHHDPAGQMSQQLGAACIIAYTSSGSTALRVSKYRPEAPILAITPNANVAKRLIMSWGVSSYLEPELASADDIFYEAAQLSLRAGMAKSGEPVVITAGMPMGKPGSTNVIKVQQVE